MKFLTSALLVALLSVPGLSQRTEDAQLAPPNTPGMAFTNTGQVVAADGEWVAISSYAHGGIDGRAGIVFLYRQSTAGFVLYQTIRVPGPALGQARCLALEENTLVIGSPHWGHPRLRIGRVFTYEWNGVTWQTGQVIEADGLAASEAPFFGYAVGLSGNVLAVTARGADEPYENAGELRIYERIQGDWQLVKRFRGRRRSGHSAGFGSSVAVEGDLIVAASATTVDRVFAYERIAGEWRPTEVLEAPVNPGSFGISLDLSGDTLVVGEPASTTGGNPRRGSVYVYSRSSDGSWALQQTLRASDGYANADYGDEFGSSVSILQDLILVGARNGVTTGVERGSAYVFQRTTSGWLPIENESLIASDPPPGWGFFGNSVCIGESALVVGDSAAMVGGLRTGKAYIFRR